MLKKSNSRDGIFAYKAYKTVDKYTKNNKKQYGSQIIWLFIFVSFFLIKLFADLDYFSNVLSPI